MTELNLIPYKHKFGREYGLSRKNLVVIIIVIAIVFVFGIMIAYPLYNLFSLQDKEKQLKIEMKNGEAILKESDKLKNDIDSYTQYIKKVSEITMLRSDSTKAIRELEKHIINDVVLSSLSYGNGTMTIEAKAKDNASIEIFVANIERKQEYKSARISSITYNQTEGIWTSIVSIQY